MVFVESILREDKRLSARYIMASCIAFVFLWAVFASQMPATAHRGGKSRPHFALALMDAVRTRGNN